MKYDYDIIIVGAGPSGLAFAQACNYYEDKKILIIDKNNSIGGCHRVNRVNGLFSEHGPRVYSDNYMTFKSLLSKMNLNFYTLFKQYNYPVTSIGKNNIYNIFSIKEYFIIILHTLYLFTNSSYGMNTDLSSFLHENNFNKESINIIDKVCRLTDGAGIDKYTLNEFLNLFNQNYLYNFYQPVLPNDIGLFSFWQKYLEQNCNVTFLLNKKIYYIDKNKVSFLNDTSLTARKIILAIPPLPLLNILNNSNDIIKKSFYSANNFENFEELKKYLSFSSYSTYINITFHWNEKLNLPKLHGFPTNEWGVFWVVQSDYTSFINENSKTVISLGICYLDNIDKVINKTANESNKSELITTAFRQLNDTYKSINYTLPVYSEAIISPNIYHSNGKWINIDTAFIKTKYGNMSYLTGIEGINIIGTHTGHQFYNFTSLESAVSNGVYIANKLYPESKRIYQVQTFTTIKDLVVNTSKILIIIGLIYFILKIKN